MSATKPILDSVLAHLQAALPHYAIQLFPDNPAQYRFVHPLGAVLIGYQGSEFKELRDVDLIAQERSISLHFTVFGRGLNSDGAALDLLDALRLAIVGFRLRTANAFTCWANAFWMKPQAHGNTSCGRRPKPCKLKTA